MDRRKIIAIDGHSSCGKSTLAKAIAKELNYLYIDSGAMYRGVTLYCYNQDFVSSKHLQLQDVVDSLPQISLSFEKNEVTGKNDLHLNGKNVEQEIRGMIVSGLVSKIAAIPEVREKLVEEQRKISKNGGVVMDGRDIGTVVFPNADYKFFVTANLETRAQRRYDEIKESQPQVTFEEVQKNLAERDHLDSTRKTSPLKQAEDAILLDNSNLNKNEQLLWVLSKIGEKS